MVVGYYGTFVELYGKSVETYKGSVGYYGSVIDFYGGSVVPYRNSV
jgi:hypothetical protein